MYEEIGCHPPILSLHLERPATMICPALSLVLLATVATARVMDSLHAIPEGWRKVMHASPTDPIALRIALRQSGGARLEQKVLEISNPGHAEYGRHMTRDEVRALTAPSDVTMALVTNWLHDHGITTTHIDNDFITIHATVSQADRLLSADFAWYKQLAAPSSAPKLRTLSYSVPDELAPHVDMVQPTTRFGKMTAHRSTVFKTSKLVQAEFDKISGLTPADVADIADATCEYVTPACLQSLYNIYYTPSANGNLVAFCSYLEQYARYSDLQSFEQQYKASATSQSFQVQKINGGKNDQNSTQDSSMFPSQLLSPPFNIS